jgi:hypothetical protein
MKRIHANTALKARARQLTEAPLHAALHHQIFGGLGEMEKPIHWSIYQIRVRRR